MFLLNDPCLVVYRIINISNFDMRYMLALQSNIRRYQLLKHSALQKVDIILNIIILSTQI